MSEWPLTDLQFEDSDDTVICKVTNDFLLLTEARQSSILILLDMSAALDGIDNSRVSLRPGGCLAAATRNQSWPT